MLILTRRVGEALKLGEDITEIYRTAETELTPEIGDESSDIQDEC